jgi:hypothetical protein
LHRGFARAPLNPPCHVALRRAKPTPRAPKARGGSPCPPSSSPFQQRTRPAPAPCPKTTADRAEERQHCKARICESRGPALRAAPACAAPRGAGGASRGGSGPRPHPLPHPRPHPAALPAPARLSMGARRFAAPPFPRLAVPHSRHSHHSHTSVEAASAVERRAVRRRPPFDKAERGGCEWVARFSKPAPNPCPSLPQALATAARAPVFCLLLWPVPPCRGRSATLFWVAFPGRRWRRRQGFRTPCPSPPPAAPRRRAHSLLHSCACGGAPYPLQCERLHPTPAPQLPSPTPALAAHQSSHARGCPHRSRPGRPRAPLRTCLPGSAPSGLPPLDRPLWTALSVCVGHPLNPPSRPRATLPRPLPPPVPRDD